jgi:hypothetical protein
MSAGGGAFAAGGLAGAESDAPHLLQNTLPCGASALQAGHFMGGDASE